MRINENKSLIAQANAIYSKVFVQGIKSPLLIGSFKGLIEQWITEYSANEDDVIQLQGWLEDLSEIQ